MQEQPIRRAWADALVELGRTGTGVYQSPTDRIPEARDMIGNAVQQVVLVRFDGRGIVEEARRIGPEARREVSFVQRETPSPGTERTFMQRLLGNIGRLGPGVPQTASGPGAASPGQR